MAEIPVPRSYNDTLGTMVDALLSELGIPKLPEGDPILSILEAAAQSDLRASQDFFQFLSSLSIDRATGLALQRIGADENLTKFPQFPSSGLVNISDSSFTKIQSTIYQGTPAPIIGSSSVNVVDALAFPSSGSIYIGRGTSQYEGPLAYTSITSFGSYYQINLAGGNNTQKFHNLGETVVLAQGGDRTINAGTIVQTPQGSTGTAVQFSTLYAAVIPDGETEISAVSVVCTQPGIIGNVPAGSINSFPTNPFVGASVTNPTSYTNGMEVEEDKDFRERIKNTRQSRSKGTALAIKTAVNGAVSVDENKRIISSSVVSQEGFPTTLYIDDGSGYEETSEGIAYEVIVDSALGGEQYFSLSNRPVSKAFVVTSNTSPYNLQPGATLNVKVGGVLYQHTFNADEFISISSASAYEVSASINGNPEVKFSARTTGNGTAVVVFADDDTNENVEVVEAETGIDANDSLGFPLGDVDTLRLYKNDILLNKDGSLATVQSNLQSSWATMTSPQTIQIVVDGVNVPGISDTYSISDADFVDAGTNYNSVSASNSLESWAQVLNFKIPGITATATNDTIDLVSNLGRNSRASISIEGGDLVSNGMFDVVSSAGASKDYTLNRNLSQIRLEDNLILAVGDRLTAGSLNTRAFIESEPLGTVNLAADGILWFSVDGNTQIVKTDLRSGSVLSYSVFSTESWGKTIRITSDTESFENVQPGDWLIITDPAFSTDVGAFRITNVTDVFTDIDIEKPSSYTPAGPYTLTTNGLVIVRTTTEPQRITIPSGSNYTALTLVDSLNTQLLGATALVYKTNRIRIHTNTFDITGDVALVLTDSESDKLLLPVSGAVNNTTSHLASALAGNSQTGTQSFTLREITSTASTTSITGADLATVDYGNFIVAARPDLAGTDSARYSNFKHISAIEDIVTNTITLRNAVLEQWLPEDLVYDTKPYALNAQDQLIALIDNDVLSKRYDINMYRKVKPTTAVYGLNNKFTDSDNANASLAKGFGLAFDWNDFAVWMKARTKTHLSAGANTTKTILYRYYRFGPEGEIARLQYRYPFSASQPVSISNDPTIDQYTDIKVFLPSDAARTGNIIRNSTKIGAAATSVTSGLYTHYYVLSLNIDSATRTSNVTTLTLGLPGPITNHGLITGNQIYVVSTDGSFSSGVKSLTGSSPTTISYTETAADAGPTANIGSVSFDTAGEAKLGTNVIVGDIWGVQSGTGLVSPFAPNATRIFTLDSNKRFWQTTTDVTSATSTTLVWYPVNDITKVSFYPVAAANTATNITTGVNAVSNSSVSAVAVGGGSGTISYATYEASPNGEGATDPWYYLTDGINFVKSNNLTPLLVTSNYELEFKKDITATLATNSDWDNEDVRLVPTTTKNVVDYLNSTATSGLSSSAEVIAAQDGQSPQISTLTPGSAGFVQVQGGSANSMTSVIKNSAVRVGSTQYAIGSFSTSDLGGLSGRTWVSLQNTIAVPKAGRITSSTALSSLDTNGNFTLSGTTAWDYATTTPGIIGFVTAEFTKQGDYVQVKLWDSASIAGVEEGDIVMISSGNANSGTFRVIRQFNDSVFWIENLNAIETVQDIKLVFLDYNSILPGDTLSINTPLWGTNNTGNFTVETIDLQAPFGTGTGNTEKFKVSSTTSSVSGPIALGSSYPLVQVIEKSASKLIKFVTGISPNASDSNLSDIKFNSYQGYEKVGAFSGTIMSSLDKLAFSTSMTQGVDGYVHTTGLVEEANKISYGVESDPATYPGIVAAGAKVNISGPLIKRITLSLGIRVQTGVNVNDVIEKVKAAAASIVNETSVGESVSISEIVKAAQEVNGVVAVSVISPTYNISNDLISIQPFEKPLVLNVSTDVSVSLVGE